jgi:hypothetical protein
MESKLQTKLNALADFLNMPLSVNSRILVLVATVVLIPTFFIPVWHLNFGAQQYPEGLELFIYPNKMVGGDRGNDLTEINVLNHYIGMAELREEDFTEFNWIPLIIGVMLVLSLRAVAIGTLSSLVDITVFTFYFACYAAWRFWYMLHSYGHDLDPKAAVKVEPFTPPIFGTKMVGQFTVESYPAAGVYLFMLFGLLMVAGMVLTIRKKK